MSTPSDDFGMSLWLLPPESYAPNTSLSRLTLTTFPQSPNFPGSPPFQPHITLCSRLPPSPTPLLPSLALSDLPSPDIHFDSLAHGTEYFKFIFLRIKKTASLLALARYLRETLFPGGEFKEEEFDPHVSLVYADLEVSEKRVEYVAWKTAVAVGESQGWKGGRVVLVDTRSKVPGEWEVKEQWSFPEEKGIL